MNLRKALAWSISGQMSSTVISFVSSIILARLLAPHDMGVFAIAMATIGILNTVAAFGVGTYVVRAVDLTPNTLASAFTVNTLISCILGGVIYAAALIERFYFGQVDVADVLGPLALAPIVNTLSFLPSTMLQREMNYKALALINAGKIVVSSIVTVILAFYGFRYMSLAYGNLASVVVGVLWVNLIVRHYEGFRLSFGESRKIAAFGFQMMSIGGVATMAMRLSDIILGNLLGLAALGLYSRASGISVLIFDNIYGAITRVLFVQLSADFREKGILRDTFLRGFEMITALIWPLLIGLAVLSRPVVYIVYGEKWLGAALPLSFLMIAQFIVICFGMNWELFVLRYETARQVRFEAVRAVVGVIAFTCGCFFSISAAAAGRIVEAIFGFILYHPHMNRMAGTKPGELIRILGNGTLLTLAAVFPSLVLMLSTGWSQVTSPTLIAGAVLLGIGLWFGVLVWQNHPLLDEMRIIGDKFRSKIFPRRFTPRIS
jgi:O-antigen/teichoic acid export membrane protein